MSKTFYTLIFIKNEEKLLLGFKKRGLGQHKWNGYGGKLKDKEDILDGAIRELYEESNLTVSRTDLKYLGVVTYIDEHHTRIVYIFTANKINGDLQETEEMRPRWFMFNDLPYEEMWPDSKFWLPLVLKDCWLQARFTYKGNCEIDDYKVTELEVAPSLNSIVDNRTYETYEQSNEYCDRAICVENN